MPDRQRHGSLSDEFARLSAARSENDPAPAGRHRGAAPAGPAQGGPAAGSEGFADGLPGSGHQIPTGEQSSPPWSDSSRADTVELSRSVWNLSALDDTTQLSRVRPSEPVAEPVAERAISPTAELTDSASGSDPAPATADADRPRQRSLRSLVERHRRRFVIGAAGLAALGALLALPPVRAQLRDSFTRLPQPYTALYFTSPPQVDGTVLTVPVSVHAVETGRDTYSVRVWTVDAKGVVDDSRTADLKWDGQALSTVVSMPVNPQADYVWVSLTGSSQVLHYKIAVA